MNSLNKYRPDELETNLFGIVKGIWKLKEKSTTKRTAVVIALDINSPNDNGKLIEDIQWKIAEFLEISQKDVKVISVDKGCVEVVIELTAQNAEKLLKAYQRREPKLAKCLQLTSLYNTRRSPMPLAFREKEEEYWRWLPDDLSKRLDIIRDRVKLIYKSCSKFPQPCWFTPHGESHNKEVEDMLHRLIPEEAYKNLTEGERFFLLASAWLHDLGMIRGVLDTDVKEGIDDKKIRGDHHTRAEKFIANEFTRCGVEEFEAPIFGLLARFHRRRCPITDCPESIPLNKYGSIRVRLLASYLRLADSLHIDQTRAPADQYAISLAYDIPNSEKLHWIRSRFVIGIEIDSEYHRLTIYFKHPASFADQTKQESSEEHRYRDNILKQIYKSVTNDLSIELNSVKDVLIREGITYFIDVEHRYSKVELDDQLQRDVDTIIDYYFLFNNPSSSNLSGIVLHTIKGILETHLPKCCVDIEKHDIKPGETSGSIEKSSTALKAIEGLLKDIRESVLETRRCHTGLRNLIKDAEEKVKEIKRGDNDLYGLFKWINDKEDKRKKNKESLFSYSMDYFTNIDSGNEKENKTEDYFNKVLELQKLKEEHKQGNQNEIKEKEKEIEIEDLKINVLLYGYSELVMETLLGFRSATFNQGLKSYEKQRDKSPDKENIIERKISDIEKQASKYFRIFICEGQPKNHTDWGGKIIFHDGTRYALELDKKGFQEIYVIPDAIAATLIGFPKPSPEKKIPKINFIIVGANGFGENEFGENIFRHSAGHAMVVSLARFVNPKDKGEPKEKWPKVVLSVTTDKYSKTSDEDKDNGNTREKEGDIVIDGWKVRKSFHNELVRENVFISQDPDLQEELKEKHISFYNPREDQIPIKYADTIITEIGTANTFEELQELELKLLKDRQEKNNKDITSLDEKEKKELIMLIILNWKKEFKDNEEKVIKFLMEKIGNQNDKKNSKKTKGTNSKS